ncbi:EAL domain-containing protein [Herbaspirillum autotrophicum]|uniref:EAL domain-containing protein n=1 Tax=Herbaspirillum autotrophicum TaxID=180195 RepID=UPI00067AC0DA|nr:EAL domain-containing protein [Herbaspirillum autotrophicum]
MIRKRLICMAVILAVAGAAIPLTLSFYLSWNHALQARQEKLAHIANKAIVRTNQVLNEVNQALHTMADLRQPACSDAHIRQMRMIAIDNRSVEEVRYVEGGLLKCTSWGIPRETGSHPATDVVLSNGMHATLGVVSAASGGKQMTGLHYLAHHVLIDPARFVDVIADGDIQLAVATADGSVLGSVNVPDPQRIRQLLLHPERSQTEQDLFAQVGDRELVAIALESRSSVLVSLQQEQTLLLPVGVILAALLVGLVGWRLQQRLSPLGELTIAVQQREFVVHYQPLMELSSGACIGAEALVRWQRQDGSMVRPDLFIPLAEQSGLILPITDQVVAAVVSDLQAMLSHDKQLHVAVNVCADDIRSGRILEVVYRALEGTGIASPQIWLEATERGFIDIDAACITLTKARQGGHRIAIDDFGTGYSSLSCLQGLPLDALKIDKSFIDTIGTEAATSSVTPHIIAMAKTLSLKVVAEGVETQAQADCLLALGVDYAQGWLYGKAMPAAQFSRFYLERKKPVAVVSAPAPVLSA